MTKQLCKCLFWGLLLFVSAPVFAQTGWLLYQGEGDIFITVGGRRQAVRDSSLQNSSVLLGYRDIIQTERGRAELRFAGKSDTILKLGENSSLMIEKAEEPSSVELYYGRIYVLAGNLTVRTGGSLTLLRAGGAAFDYLARPGVSQPVLSVHCLEGTTEITARPGTEGTKFTAKKGESLSVEYRVPFVYVERKNVDSSVLSFWRIEQSTFRTADDPRTASDPRLAANPQAAQQGTQGTAAAWQEEPQGETARSAMKPAAKAVKPLVIAGFSLIGIGAAAQGYGYFTNPEKELRDRLFYGGYGSLGLGVASLAAAFILSGSLRNTASR